jgi:hypothetical protein
MLSSDKNVETIAQLIEVLKHYLGLQSEYVKLDVIDKVVRFLTATSLAILFFMFVIAILMFFSFAIACWLATWIGMAKAFLIVSGIHIILLFLFIIFRKEWIEKPLVRFFVSLFS